MLLKLLKLSTVLTFLFGITVLQAQTMYVKQTSGVQASYFLNNIRKLSFSSGNITVSKFDGISESYALYSVRYLSFSDFTVLSEIEKRKGTLYLYPVPATNILYIQLPDIGIENSIIEIISIEGKVIFKSLVNTISDIYQLNVSIMPKGLYLCRYNNGISNQTAKFIKN